MGFDLLSVLGLLGGDPKKLLKSLGTVEKFWEYTTGRIEDYDSWSDEQKVAARQMFDELVAMLGLRKILKRG